MKKAEITYNTIANELSKLTDRLEKARKSLEKKTAAAEKLGVANMTNEEHREWLKAVPTTELGFMTDKNDVKKNGAWFDMIMAQDRVEEIEYKIESAKERFAKAEADRTAYLEEIERIADLKQKEELWKLEFEQEQKEWKKDGIILEDRYRGITPKGKKFFIYGNSGFTERSRHCFTLYIDGETIFTSGEFWTAYDTIRKS